MITVNIRKQGGAAIMTIPANVLRLLNVGVGATLELEVEQGAFVARPISQAARKRYSLKELLQGATPEIIEEVNAETAWVRDGDVLGREIL